MNCPISSLASFPCSYSTAENLLTRASVKAGDRVLVTGASGGVGSAAVQLAKARGAYVMALTSPSKSDAVSDLGADEVLLRETDLVEALGVNGIDVVVDLVAGDKWPQYLEVLCPGGRYAVAGAIAGPLVELDVRTLYLKDLSLFGCTVLGPDVFKNLIDASSKVLYLLSLPGCLRWKKSAMRKPCLWTKGMSARLCSGFNAVLGKYGQSI